MNNRHAKFAKYWESLGKPQIEVMEDRNGFWKKLPFNEPNWIDRLDYRIEGDDNWGLIKEWVDSDFTIHIEYQSPSTGEWLPVDGPLNGNFNVRKAEKKDLTIEQQVILHQMLGKATVKFERNGTYFCSARMPHMDALVTAGALHIVESIEPWGPQVVYSVSEESRRAIATAFLAAGHLE